MELGLAPGPWAGEGSRPEGNLPPDEPRLPASATPQKLKKNALRGAHVVSEAQIFFLPTLHFSQRRLSR